MDDHRRSLKVIVQRIFTDFATNMLYFQSFLTKMLYLPYFGNNRFNMSITIYSKSENCNICNFTTKQHMIEIIVVEIFRSLSTTASGALLRQTNQAVFLALLIFSLDFTYTSSSYFRSRISSRKKRKVKLFVVALI